MSPSPMERTETPGERLIRDLLIELGLDPERGGLQETPKRVIASWKFLLSGYNQDPASVLKCFEDGAEQYDEMVLQANIPVYSTCEHHLLPFFGVAHVGYLPKGKVVGLSKLTRLVDIYSRRLQVQERMTREIAIALQTNLQTQGVGVVLRCRHMCMECRGVQKMGTITYTSALLGSLLTHGPARSEFLNFVTSADAYAKP